MLTVLRQPDFGDVCMSDSPSREEVKRMIEDAVERKVRDGVDQGLDTWMSKYGLKPTHWVYLDAEYHKMLARQSQFRRIVYTAIFGAVVTATIMGGRQWIQRVLVEHDRQVQEQSKD